MIYEDEVFEGNTYELSLIYKDEDNNEIDLTTSTLELKLSRNYNSSVVTVTPSSVTGGRVDFLVAPATLSVFSNEEADLDLILNVNATFSNGSVKTILNGILKYKRAL